MKLASIDIGTNSTRLLIVDYSTLETGTLIRKAEITRIGENLDSTGMISKNSSKKTLEVLFKYRQLIKEAGVEKYRTIGTSALRRAKNKDWFISYIYENLGISIEIITGIEEAKLSFSGAVRDLDIDRLIIKNKTDRLEDIFYDDKCQIDKLSSRNRFSSSHYNFGKDSINILVIDIGGGSSEFILGDCSSKIILAESVDIGCVRLTEKFISADPPEPEELNKMHSYIKDKLRNTIEKIKKHKFLAIIGLAGTITTLAAIDLRLKEYNSGKIHHHTLDLDKIKYIYNYLCSINLKERKNITGLEPKRADIIIAGTAIIIEVLKSLEKNNVIVSEKDILDGIIYSLIDF